MTPFEKILLVVVTLALLVFLAFGVISMVSLERRYHTLERDWNCAIHGRCN